MAAKVNDYAILGLNLGLSLGQSWKPVTIFQNLSIKVPKGAIYGLIGPSGCGKTTLQRCIFGFYRPTHGRLLVFGRSPLEKGFGVPGPLVGFMPQDLALNEDLTIKEMLTFFGRLNDLPMSTVNSRIDELLSVIDIPYPHRLISNLSIGQRRRISLAASLIHRPKLLLLDEPTVGSDPLLVYKMWTYLFHLRDTYKMTIVVTTHYLEEIVKADRFGLMRKGQIIAEDNPKSFMESYKETSLEKAVFKLCTEWDKQNESSSPPPSSSSSSTCPEAVDVITCANKFSPEEKMTKVTVEGTNQPSSSSSSSSCSTLTSTTSSLASTSKSSSFSSLTSSTESWEPLSNCTVLSILIWRLWLRCKRFMIYPIILSCFVIFIIIGTFGSMFGRFPKGLTLDYMYSESGNQNISEKFLYHLARNNISLNRVYSELQSRRDLENGLIDGYFIIGETFGDLVKERIEKGLSSFAGGPMVSGSQGFRPSVADKILLTVDSSNQFNVDTLDIMLTRSLNKLLEEIRSSLNISVNYYQFFTIDPIYKSHESDDLMLSNEMVLIRYFLYAVEQFTILLMMSWTMQEVKEKMNERLMAAGIGRVQLIFALILTATMVIVPIYMILFTILIPTLNFPMRGSFLAVVLTTFAITLCGITKGVLTGLVSSDLIVAAFVHSGYCFCSLFISYLIWPYESLPNFIKPLSIGFPLHLRAIRWSGHWSRENLSLTLWFTPT
ncbi:ABC transporter G family member 23-like [Panonychus citri]|uniref:ABC transporter G family member 23-like n=1 Tax=Panonychus citri TaxID=50023 RepID=UPI0023074E17|nr:ABC transporter G family member 23-like [Panonychus citri]XP_053211928.1 ABC transporter G family member 23-like [Panonychus citri]